MNKASYMTRKQKSVRLFVIKPQPQRFSDLAPKVITENEQVMDIEDNPFSVKHNPTVL